MTSDDQRSLSNKDFEITQPHLSGHEVRENGDFQDGQGSPIRPRFPACPYQPGDLIGRYEMVSELGTGGFGHVVQANDPTLRRIVAIKFPRPDRMNESRQAFIEEGRAIARLKHPSIVPIYNVEETEDGLPFVVMEFVNGRTLAEVIRGGAMTYTQAIHYLIQIARALTFAHAQTVIHRDLKPSNVMIANDNAMLMDFGMALHDLTPEESLVNVPQGTPPYMAPEQVRGETHRLDRRTDIWGFGVMLYEILTGTRPFAGKELTDLTWKICSRPPKPPRDCNPQAPAELERICLKCLEKRMKDRYQTSADLVEDLESFFNRWTEEDAETIGATKINDNMFSSSSLQRRNQSVGQQPSRTIETADHSLDVSSPIKIVPKGLRSFDGHDAEFFMDMLAGPKDRAGIPDSIRFWINRLEPGGQDPVSVGLIYGPSGCGKSSFVKAGLIPTLPAHVQTIYIEATAHKTEDRLLSKIESLHPNVTQNEKRLPVVLSRIRRGHILSGEKLLIVIDQFEQWLHNHSDYDSHPLTQALRQCDGDNLAVVILVRDDFWMSITQFMSALDSTVQEGVNALGIPLFDRRHARKVLTGFGRALGALPQVGQKMDATQVRFVREAVDQMDDRGHVIPVHIAMLAQMMDAESWHFSNLKKMGGWQGIGVQFLENLFSDKRLDSHQDSCRLLLISLLPDSSAPIKGTHKSVSQLSETTGLNDRPTLQFILDLLDRDFRIITSVESDETKDPHYQLAHDSLVIPVKTWIANKDNETWRGRARARLSSLAHQWDANHKENRFLPSLFEFSSMLFGVPSTGRSKLERQFLAKSGIYYLVRLALMSVLMVAVGIAFQQFFRNSELNLTRDRVMQLASAHPLEIEARMQMLEEQNPADVLMIANEHTGSDWSKREDLHYLLARSQFCNPPDFPVAELVAAIRTAPHNECENILRQLRLGMDEKLVPGIPDFIAEQFDSANSVSDRFRLAVIAMHLDELAPISEFLAAGPDPEQREYFIETYPKWHGSMADAINLLDTFSDQWVLSALCKSLGLIDTSDFSDDEKEQLVLQLQRLYSENRFASVHSASEWLLTKLGAETPTNLSFSTNRDWTIHDFGNGRRETFVRVNPHSFEFGSGLPESQREYFLVEPHTETIDEPFFVAAREVSIGLFYEFIESLEDDDELKKFFSSQESAKQIGENLPMTPVSWIDSARFCNWLSKRADRNPVYIWDPKENRFQVESDANGFRMPTVVEWEALNRALTSSRYFFGEPDHRIARYAWTVQSSVPLNVSGVGTRGHFMPNDFGVFDSLSNAFEWCQDPYVNSQLKTNPDLRESAFRGGSATEGLRYFQSASYFNMDIFTRSFQQGIRLVYDAN